MKESTGSRHWGRGEERKNFFIALGEKKKNWCPRFFEGFGKRTIAGRNELSQNCQVRFLLLLLLLLFLYSHLHSTLYSLAIFESYSCCLVWTLRATDWFVETNLLAYLRYFNLPFNVFGPIWKQFEYEFIFEFDTRGPALVYVPISFRNTHPF